MILQNCIISAPEAGDCFRACVASITGIDIREIPNFMDLPTEREGYEHARDWLKQFGMSLYNDHCSNEWSLPDILKWRSAEHPDVPLILCGASGSDENHAVVALGGKIFHNPSGAPITGPCHMGHDSPPKWWIYLITASSNWSDVNKRGEK